MPNLTGAAQIVGIDVSRTYFRADDIDERHSVLSMKQLGVIKPKRAVMQKQQDSFDASARSAHL